MTVPNTIVFDFDGVILESNDIKTNAFQELFRAYPEHQERIVQLHLDNGGMSRFEKFKIIYRDFLKKLLDVDELDRLGTRFSDLVFQAVLQCPFVSGAREFLEKYSAHYRLFVASGTPQEELRSIVKIRRLDALFQGVYGSPTTKTEILQRIMNEAGLNPTDLVFIGDALGDYQAARDMNIGFIGRVPPGKPNRFPREGVLGIVDDLKHLDARWSLIVTTLDQAQWLSSKRCQ